MNILTHLYPGDTFLLLALSVLLQATVVILAAWLASTLFFRRHAAVRHGLWLAALVLVLLSPATALLMNAANVRLVAVSLPEFMTEEEPVNEAPAEVVRAPSNNVGALNSPLFAREALAPAPSPWEKMELPERLPRDFASLDASPSADASLFPMNAAPIETQSAEPAPAAPVQKISPLARLRAVAAAIFALWLLGIAYGLVRIARGGLALRRLLAMALPGENDPRLHSVLAEIERHLGLKRMPPVLLWRDAKLQITPLTVGIVRPVIVLSKKISKSLTPEELYEVLLHECAHVLRRDSAVGLLQRIARVLFWPYPLVAVLNRQLTIAREEVCDNYVLLHTSGPQYAQTLFDLSERIHPLASNLAPVALFQHHCPLEKRVAGLLDLRRNVMTKINRWAALCLAFVFLTIAILAAGTKLLRAQAVNNPPEVTAEAKTDTQKPEMPATPEKTETQPKASEKSSDKNAADSTAEKSEAPKATKIAGTCVDEEKRPIPEAKVSLYKAINGISCELMEQTKTDKDGKFAFAELMLSITSNIDEVRVYYVVAQVQGKARAYRRFDNYLPRDDLGKSNFVMKEAVTIKGSVTDSNGKPIVGAKVSNDPYNFMFDPMTLAVTDREGRYEINDMEIFDSESNRRALYAYHPDYARIMGYFSKSPCTLDFVLQPSSTIEGRVIDSVTGKPVVNAFLSAEDIPNPLFACPPVPPAYGVTDSEGRYQIASLPAGKYKIFAQARDRVARAIESFELKAAEKQTAPDIKLIEGGFIEGRIVDADTGDFIKESRRVLPMITIYGPSFNNVSFLARNGKCRIRVTPGKYLVNCFNLGYPWDVEEDETFNKEGKKPLEVAAGQTVQVEFKILRIDQSYVGGSSDFPYLVKRRAVNKLVKDFPEKTNLSTPEAVVARMIECFAKKNFKDADKLFWVNWAKRAGIDDLQKLEEKLRNEPPFPHPNDNSKKLLETEIIQVLTFREDLAEVICRIDESVAGSDGPYFAFLIGKHNNIWKLLTCFVYDSAAPNIEDFKTYFEQNKEAQWNLFQQVKKDIDRVGNAKSEVILQVLPWKKPPGLAPLYNEASRHDSIERHTVYRRVKDISEKVDLSSPFGAFVSLARANLSKDPDWINKHYWEKWDMEDAFYAASIATIFPQNNPISPEDKILAVLTYRNEIAVVIVTKLNADGSSPTNHFYYGRIRGTWKIIGMYDAVSKTVVEYQQVFDQHKEAIWNAFQEVKKNVGDDPNGHSPKVAWPVVSEPSPIKRREVNKLVKDFPEKTDLSTPESALAAYNRATFKKDTKAVLDLFYKEPSPAEAAEVERFWKSDTPEDMATYLQSVLDAEIIEVNTYRDDLAEVVSKLKFPEGFGRHPYSARTFGRFGDKWKNIGEDRLPSLEAARENFERKKENIWQQYIEAKDIAEGKKPAVKPANEFKLPPDKYAAVKATTPDGERLILMGLVENFFNHNARDITARKTLQWGEVKKNDDGSRSIRYKFEARIWDRETMIADQIFTFDKDNVLLGYKDAAGPPVKKEPQKVDVNTTEGLKALVEDFFANNFRDVTARKTLEWGEVEKDADGNSTIRYKYEATIWDKDVQIMNQIFTFDKKGEFVRYKNVEGYPRKVDKPKDASPKTDPSPKEGAANQAFDLNTIALEGARQARAIKTVEYEFDAPNFDYRCYHDGKKYRVETLDNDEDHSKASPVVITAYNGEKYFELGRPGLLITKKAALSQKIPVVNNPLFVMYSWMDELRAEPFWESIGDVELWKKTLARGKYLGEIDVNGVPCHHVRLESPKAFVEVFFAKELRCYPMRWASQSREDGKITSKAEVVQYKLLDTEAGKCLIPLEIRSVGSSVIDSKIKKDSLKINQPIDAALFTLSPTGTQSVIEAAEIRIDGDRITIDGIPLLSKKNTETKKPQDDTSRDKTNSEEIDKRWRWVFDDAEDGKALIQGNWDLRIKYVDAGLQVARQVLKVSEEANQRVAGTVPKKEILRQELEVDLQSLRREYCFAVQQGDEKRISQIAVRFAESNVDYRQTVLDISTDANKRVPGTVPAKEVERMTLQRGLAKITLEAAKAQAERDEKKLQELSKQRAELEAKLKADAPSK